MLLYFWKEQLEGEDAEIHLKKRIFLNYDVCGHVDKRVEERVDMGHAMKLLFLLLEYKLFESHIG